MSNHQKRLSAPTSWPIERKEETFTVKADAGPHGEAGVPLLVLLRDVLGYVDSRKEANFALDHDQVLVNGKPVSDEERPIGMFDILAFTEREEFYRVFPDEGGRLSLTPIDEESAGSKLGKVEEKRQVPGGETQLTMHDGETLLVDDETEYDAGDSLVIDNDDGSIVAHFPYEEGELVTAVDGQHSGEIGTLEEIRVTPGSSPNTVTVETDEGTFETVEDYVVVIDENFTEGESDASEADEESEEQEAKAESDESEAKAESEEESEESDAEESDTRESAEEESAEEGGDDE